MTDVKLKPCPFCGEKANISHMEKFGEHKFGVICSGCRAHSNIFLVSLRYDSKENKLVVEKNGLDDAVSAWNRRADNNIRDNPELLEEEKDEY